MDSAGVARELYGLAPADFVATRTARAKAAAGSDKALAAEIRALPKPSVAAFVVNQLMRSRADAIEELIELGAALRQAQGGLDGAELRRLDEERRRLTRALAVEGALLAAEMGQRISAAASDQVGQTLHAAMADPDAAEAVRTGRLSRGLSATGFGRVDIGDAVAAPGVLASVTSLTDRRSRLAQAAEERELLTARADLLAAEREAAEAAVDAQAAEREVQQASERRTELTSEVRRLRALLVTAERELKDSKAGVSAARSAMDKADSGETEAQRALESARATLEQLTRAPDHGPD